MTELDLSNLWQAAAEGDAGVRAKLGVFRGTASIAVFKDQKGGTGGGGGPIAKFNFINKRTNRSWFADMVTRATKMSPGDSASLPLQDFDREQRKFFVTANITVGKDEKGIVYFGITGHKDLATVRFPFRMSRDADFSQALPPAEQSVYAANDFVAFLRDDVSRAIMMTSVKRDPNNNSRPSGGQPSRGSYSGNQAPASNSGSVLDDELAF